MMEYEEQPQHYEEGVGEEQQYVEGDEGMDMDDVPVTQEDAWAVIR